MRDGDARVVFAAHACRLARVRVWFRVPHRREGRLRFIRIHDGDTGDGFAPHTPPRHQGRLRFIRIIYQNKDGGEIRVFVPYAPLSPLFASISFREIGRYQGVTAREDENSFFRILPFAIFGPLPKDRRRAGSLDGKGAAPRSPHMLWLEGFEAIAFSGADSIISILCGAISRRSLIPPVLILRHPLPSGKGPRKETPYVVARKLRGHSVSRR